jgi:mitotic spindle assembly checkpoint protein MAD1
LGVRWPVVEDLLADPPFSELDYARKELSALVAKNEKFEEEFWNLKGDIGRGAHLPPGVRVLELIGNPAQAWFGKREEDVAKLKKENEALRELVKDGSQVMQMDRNAEGVVPRATLEVLQKEKAELEQTIREKEKRLLRLQEVRSPLQTA